MNFQPRNGSNQVDWDSPTTALSCPRFTVSNLNHPANVFALCHAQSLIVDTVRYAPELNRSDVPSVPLKEKGFELDTSRQRINIEKKREAHTLRDIAVVRVAVNEVHSRHVVDVGVVQKVAVEGIVHERHAQRRKRRRGHLLAVCTVHAVGAVLLRQPVQPRRPLERPDLRTCRRLCKRKPQKIRRLSASDNNAAEHLSTQRTAPLGKRLKSASMSTLVSTESKIMRSSIRPRKVKVLSIV